MLLGTAVFFPAFFARAADFSSLDYMVKDPVISRGIGTSASTSFQNTATIGQPALGISNSTSFVLSSGFLYFPAVEPAPSSSPSSINGTAFGGGGGGGGGGSGGAPSSGTVSQPSVLQPLSSIVSAVSAPLVSVLGGITNFISKFLPRAPTSPQLAAPTVPKEAPLALKGPWNLLSLKELGAFVFAPLPRDVAVLGEKFPTVGDTFKAAGVTRFSDLSKLQNVGLSLPNLMERIGIQPVALKIQPFALPKGIPILALSSEEKARIPSEIVFARVNGEKIDLPINLSLQENGVLEKTIRTVAGSTLHLVVRPEYAARSVKGYLLLKSRMRREQRSIREELPLQNMLASIFFVRPVFAEPANNATYHLLAGAGLSTNRSDRTDMSDTAYRSDTTDTTDTTDTIAFIGPQGTNVEERLALAEFEYTDPDGDGIYTADVRAPAVDGEYELITLISYEDPRFGVKEVSLTAVVDPEGYVFERNGDKETRIPGAVVSLSYLNPATKKYELWPGRDYTQENPQITDVRGTYAFLASPGTYAISVTAPGYLDYHGKPFQLTENNQIHMNIQLTSPYGFFASLDLKTVLLIMLFLLIGFNFYKDKLREIINKGQGQQLQ